MQGGRTYLHLFASPSCCSVLFSWKQCLVFNQSHCRLLPIWVWLTDTYARAKHHLLLWRKVGCSTTSLLIGPVVAMKMSQIQKVIQAPWVKHGDGSKRLVFFLCNQEHYDGCSSFPRPPLLQSMVHTFAGKGGMANSHAPSTRTNISKSWRCT